MNYSNGSVGTTIGMDSGPEITRHLLKVTTDALLAHLKALQEVTNKLKEKAENFSRRHNKAELRHAFSTCVYCMRFQSILV